MRTERGLDAPGRWITISLKREGWAGRASFAWVRSDRYPELASDYCSFLHREEIRYYESLTVEKRRCSYLLGRFAAKKAIRNYSDLVVDDTQIQIASGVFNQPLVRPGFDDPIGISISHSESVACSLAFP